jgi:acyl-ACP thioesterase
MPICDTIRAVERNAQRITIPSVDNEFEYVTTSRLSDIDVNGHINNAKYAEWAINAIPLDLYKNSSVKEVSMNFLSEGFYGDEIRIKTKKIDSNRFSFTIERNSDSKVLSVVELT